MKIKDIVFAYCEDIKYEVKQHTYWIYVVMARRIEDWLQVDENTPKNYLNEYLANKKYSYSTKKMLKSLINRSLDFANKSGLLNFGHRITLKLQESYVRKVEALSIKEQKILEDYIFEKKNVYYYGIIICLYAGLRLGELASLRWQDVNFKDNTITINQTTCFVAGREIEDLPKSTCSQRQIPISKKLKNVLLEMKENAKSHFVLSGIFDKKINMRSYQQTFSQLLHKLNIRHYGFHALRHTFANRLMQNKVDIKTISELMGHNSADVTLKNYIHTSYLQKDRAIDSLDCFNKKPCMLAG